MIIFGVMSKVDPYDPKVLTPPLSKRGEEGREGRRGSGVVMEGRMAVGVVVAIGNHRGLFCKLI